MGHYRARIQRSSVTPSSAKDENMEGTRLDSVYLFILLLPSSRHMAELQAIFCVSFARPCDIIVQGFNAPALLRRPQRTKIWKVHDLIACTFYFLDHQRPGIWPNCKRSFACRSPGHGTLSCKDSTLQRYSVVRKGRKYGRYTT